MLYIFYFYVINHKTININLYCKYFRYKKELESR